MFDVVKRLLKHSIVYAVAAVLNRAVTIIMLPIYTRYLLKPEYGALEIFWVTSSVIMAILQLGIGSALFRNVIYIENADRKVLTSTAQYFLVVFSLISILILLLFAPQLSMLLLGSTTYVNMLRLIFIGDFFLVFATVPMTRLRIDERSGLFAIIAGGNFFIGIVLNVLFVVVFKMGLFGAVLAMTLNAAAFAVIYSIVIWKDFILSFSFSDLKDMLGFGLPLVPASIFVLVLNMADRYFIRYYLGLDQVADYGAAARLSMIIALLVNAFQMAWPAVLFSIAKQKEGPQVFARLFNYFNALLLFSSLVIALFAQELLSLLATKSYLEAAPIVSLLVLSSVFFGVNYFTSIGVQVKKKTLYYPLLIGIAAIINLVICLVSIPRQGLWGAAFAKLVSFAFLGISICLVSLKFYSIPFQIKKTMLIYFSAIGLYFLGVSVDLGIWTIPFKIMMIIVFVVLMFVFQLVEISHVNRLLPSFLKTTPRIKS